MGVCAVSLPPCSSPAAAHLCCSPYNTLKKEDVLKNNQLVSLNDAYQKTHHCDRT